MSRLWSIMIHIIMIYHLVWFCWVIRTKMMSPYLFLINPMNPFLSFLTSFWVLGLFSAMSIVCIVIDWSPFCSLLSTSLSYFLSSWVISSCLTVCWEKVDEYFIHHQQQYYRNVSSWIYSSHTIPKLAKLGIFSDETCSSVAVLILLSYCLSLNFFCWIPFLSLSTRFQSHAAQTRSWKTLVTQTFFMHPMKFFKVIFQNEAKLQI